jgi:hypothetical protein
MVREITHMHGLLDVVLLGCVIQPRKGKRAGHHRNTHTEKNGNRILKAVGLISNDQRSTTVRVRASHGRLTAGGAQQHQARTRLGDAHCADKRDASQAASFSRLSVLYPTVYISRKG